MENNTAEKSVEEVLFRKLAEHLERPVDLFGPETRISSISLDSIVAVTVLSELQESLKLDLPPVLFWECATLGEVVGHIEKLKKTG